ncbi:hypothetical protein BJ508DRAFT_304051 [Ascobolus immersus RN42]|uniref:Uncharacterized protein n=1 Tax=Ascobolus immersus RN42 TaxID=1160509 RepID=A0A3N4IRM1_ASCIM|nr:hypothetical protein BJ508DRAFT_304051 [Ascobolus immersus RN42]
MDFGASSQAQAVHFTPVIWTLADMFERYLASGNIHYTIPGPTKFSTCAVRNAERNAFTLSSTIVRNAEIASVGHQKEGRKLEPWDTCYPPVTWNIAISSYDKSSAEFITFRTSRQIYNLKHASNPNQLKPQAQAAQAPNVGPIAPYLKFPYSPAPIQNRQDANIVNQIQVTAGSQITYLQSQLVGNPQNKQLRCWSLRGDPLELIFPSSTCSFSIAPRACTTACSSHFPLFRFFLKISAHHLRRGSNIHSAGIIEQVLVQPD